jgi:hypothetical protein
MVLRVLMSTNPARFRVSKPGKDAGLDGAADMLIDTDNDNTKVITSGRLRLAGTTNIVFGITLPSIPAVDIQSSDAATYSMLPFRKWGYAQTKIQVTPSTTGIKFVSSTVLWVNYVVVAMTMPV